MPARMATSAYDWLAQVLQQNQRPELVDPRMPRDNVPRGTLNQSLLQPYPTSNWVAPPMGQTPLGMQSIAGQNQLGALKRLRGF